VATTLAFMTLAFAQIFHLGNARSARPVLSPRQALGNPYAMGAAVLALVLQILVALFSPLSRVLHVTPLSTTEWLVVVVLGLIPAILGQTIKTVGAVPR
jgi:Ca2+-transporting ATPase